MLDWYKKHVLLMLSYVLKNGEFVIDTNNENVERYKDILRKYLLFKSNAKVPTANIIL